VVAPVVVVVVEVVLSFAVLSSLVGWQRGNSYGLCQSSSIPPKYPLVIDTSPEPVEHREED